jgi:hypothetical protein
MAAAYQSSERVAPGEPVEVLAQLRAATARWADRERARGRVTTGMSDLDVRLAGGWPLGRVAEVVGPLSSGIATVAAATLAAATGREELGVWIDAADTFDPTSMAAAGVDLERVLWVRPRGLEEAVRAAELALELCGFAVAVLDLTGAPREGGRRGGRRTSLRLRLVRAVERTGAVALVLGERPWVGTLAGVSLALGKGTARWRGGEQGAPRWLEGITLHARVARGRTPADVEPPAVLPWRESATG